MVIYITILEVLFFKLKDDPQLSILFDISNTLEFSTKIKDDELGVIYSHNDCGQENKKVKLTKVVDRDKWDYV